MSEKDDLERKLSELLEEGEMESGDRSAKEIRQISPKYEIRIQTTLDPIVEETLRYRSMAWELDGRYDKYLKRTPGTQGEPEDSGRGGNTPPGADH